MNYCKRILVLFELLTVVTLSALALPLVAQNASPLIFLGDAITGNFWELSSQSSAPIFKFRLSEIVGGFTVVPSQNKIYWTEIVPGKTIHEATSGNIWRANLNGSDRELLFANAKEPRDIQVDTGAHLMFWAEEDSGELVSCEITVCISPTILTSISEKIFRFVQSSGTIGVKLDPEAQNVYFLSYATNIIYRISYLGEDNGAVREELVIPEFSKVGELSGLEIDLEHNILYWSDVKNGNIQFCPVPTNFLDFCTPEQINTLVEFVAGNALAVAADPLNDFVYWVDEKTGTLRRVSTKETNQFNFETIASVNQSLWFLQLVYP